MKFKKAFITLLTVSFVPSALHSGPPFVTDDPQPVNYKYWEFYLASGQSFSGDGTEATLPHVEINYGLVPEVQVHLLLPMEFINSNGISRYGFSFTEFGVKYRLLDETESRPQVGIFPIVELPIGITSNLNGSKSVQTFLPIWMQKSWRNLTTYGGSGIWLNPGSDKKNQLFVGWEAQYDFTKALTLGGEIFYLTPDNVNSPSRICFNLGGYINFSEENHFLFSFGHSLHGEEILTGYIAYQLMI
jgi:hypothetical protein